MKLVRLVGLAVIAMIAMPVAATVTAQDGPSATVEVRVWQDVGDELAIYISARPAGGSWRTLGTIPLPLDDGVSSSGRFRYGDIAIDVPLPGQTSAATVEVRVWQDVNDSAGIYVSARPADGSWRTLGTIPLPLDDGVSSSGRFRYGDISLDVPLPAPPPVARTIFTGELADLEYSIGLADRWARTAEHEFAGSDPWSLLFVSAAGGPLGQTLQQQAESIRNGLEREIAQRWPSYSLFEFTSLEEVTVEGRTAYELRYRAQEAPEFCAISFVERVAVAEAWHGETTGLRATIWLCEGAVDAHGAARQATLDTFRVWAAPSNYYTQALLVDGVLIKAAAQVDPDALTEAGAVIGWMLETAREDIRTCLAATRAALAIIPADEFVTTLPEFANLAGGGDFTGRTYDSFDIRGLGAVRGQPVSSASEESLLGDRRDLNITVHEFAHGIENLCLTPAELEQWKGYYEAALEENRYPGTHAMHDQDEFFAVFSSSYFGVTDELGDRNTSRELIRTEFPDVFESLEDIYGSPEPGAPPE